MVKDRYKKKEDDFFPRQNGVVKNIYIFKNKVRFMKNVRVVLCTAGLILGCASSRAGQETLPKETLPLEENKYFIQIENQTGTLSQQNGFPIYWALVQNNLIVEQGELQSAQRVNLPNPLQRLQSKGKRLTGTTKLVVSGSKDWLSSETEKGKPFTPSKAHKNFSKRIPQKFAGVCSGTIIFTVSGTKADKLEITKNDTLRCETFVNTKRKISKKAGELKQKLTPGFME